MTTGEGTGHPGLVTVLSEVATRVQRARTHDDVLRIVGEGVVRVGMRCLVFQIDQNDLVLRYLATTPERHEAVERTIKRRLVGLRAPLERCGPARDLLALRQIVYRNDIDVFARFVEAAMGRTPSVSRVHDGIGPLSLDAGAISNGVIAPLFVRDEPWGLISFVSATLHADDRAAVALFATQIASALEVADLLESLERARQELSERERLATIGELAATVAHEVRNPLGVLFNSVASLRRILPTEVAASKVSDAEVLLSIVTEETERLNEIVSDLLELARPWAMRTKEASLGTLVRTAVAELPRLADASAVNVRVELADLPPVEIDTRMIRQALFNLMTNAVQAMPQGGTLRIETRMEHRDDVSFACVDVSGTAEAPSSANRKNVLESTTKPSGTGLGLTLVKRIVEAHQGELGIVGSAEDGVVVTMRIPIPQWDDSHVTLRREAVVPRPLRVAGTGR